eukprot:Plantae.Rhodophyta-Hildenbrandia_rubra.ctg29237.p1 GENE.Plantae.Rhodophyta-Hildenbrandia_rubra.ctg29237~~Plantae.Rhodophyta-Hildenbrandia_rubra.ctg29237.p1  ORF type:complete len:725 (+),score=102.98 Plantae.Rhodophyta-Hildenbrandia_rubra.ctg29237:133-2307(+)
MDGERKRRRLHSSAEQAPANPYLAHHSLNPFTGHPYTSRYYSILEVRKTLPVHRHREDIIAKVRASPVIILVGDTGSGKTTQVPQFLVEDGYTEDGRLVACTQPRRVAALSVAKRVSEEMDVVLGDEVGYSIRFEDRSSNRTKLKYLTDGMLLREAMVDPELSRYAVIILDEAHERTLNTDILLGLLKGLITRRQDLRIVVMSATLDAGKFQAYFNDAPLFEVAGRMYPVEILYSPEPETDYVQAAVRTVIEIHLHEPAGDILVFLTGEDEIEESCRLIEDKCHATPGSGPVMAMPLYSSLQQHRQNQVFDPAPPGVRKIICSTNIAETSVTIDGIVYVVDPGYSKQKVYNPRVCMESLLVSAISRASASQRCGRAGRTKPGKCYRLYTEESYKTEMQESSYPEILTSNLGNVVLQLVTLGIEDLVHFDFIEPPDPERLMRALELLNYLGALDDEGDLTRTGEMMAQFPLEPELSKLLITAPQFGCSNEILSLVALLNVGKPIFQRPKDRRREADRAKEKFVHPDGDHLSLLNAYHAYKQAGPNAQQFCWSNFLDGRALKTVDNIRGQLENIMRRNGLELVSTDFNSPFYFDNIRRALISGYFMQIACKDPKTKRVYLTARDDQRVTFHPSCGLKYYPEFVLFHEFVLTQTYFIRTVTTVKSAWLVEIAPKYFKSSTFPPGVMRKALLKIEGNLEEKLVYQKNKGKKNKGKKKKKDRQANGSAA